MRAHQQPGTRTNSLTAVTGGAPVCAPNGFAPRIRKPLSRALLAAGVFGTLTLLAIPAHAQSDQAETEPKTGGLGEAVAVELTGKATAVAGVVDGNDLRGDIDAEVELKASTILDNGLELGAVIQGRYDEDQPGQLFSGGRRSSFLFGGARGLGPQSGDAFVQ
ncbi:MAG: hypothetical protein AAFU58_11135, partial [Pseudomonadota bacterium]